MHKSQRLLCVLTSLSIVGKGKTGYSGVRQVFLMNLSLSTTRTKTAKTIFSRYIPRTRDPGTCVFFHESVQCDTYATTFIHLHPLRISTYPHPPTCLPPNTHVMPIHTICSQWTSQVRAGAQNWINDLKEKFPEESDGIDAYLSDIRVWPLSSGTTRNGHMVIMNMLCVQVTATSFLLYQIWRSLPKFLRRLLWFLPARMHGVTGHTGWSW